MAIQQPSFFIYAIGGLYLRKEIEFDMNSFESLGDNNKAVVWANRIGYYIDYDTGSMVNPRGAIIVGSIGFNKYRYTKIIVAHNGKKKPINLYFHKLMAYQIFGDMLFRKGMCVRYINRDRLDNRYINISIGTYAENLSDFPKGLKADQMARIGRRFRKLSFSAAEDIRRKNDLGASYNSLAIEYGVSSASVRQICLFITYKLE